MAHIVSYTLTPEGILRVRLLDGRERPATDREWLHLWQADPRLTLRLVH